MLESIRDWAFAELREVKHAPVAIALVLLVGGILGWWSAQQFYSERIAVMEQRIAASTPLVLAPTTIYVNSRGPWFMALVVFVGLVFQAVVAARRKRNVRGLSGEVESLSGMLSDAKTQHDEDIETLKNRDDEVRQIVEDCENSLAILKTKKRQLAHDRLRFYGQMSMGGKRPTVTIRFVGHGPDYALVEAIEKIITDFTGWPVVRDGTNNPALPKAGQFKVILALRWSRHSRIWPMRSFKGI